MGPSQLTGVDTRVTVEVSMILQKRRFAFSVALIVILLTSSCTNIGRGINTSIAPTESTDMPTTIPENTPTLIPLPTETKPVPTPLPAIKTQCVGTSKETQKLDLSGVVALNQAAKPDSFEWGFYLLNLKNGNTIRDVDDGMFTQVSPDRMYLAYKYLRGDTGFLSVLNSNGKTISDFEFTFDGLVVAYFNWQNPEQLRILHEGMGDRLSAQLLNPFTQENAPLRTDWSGMYAPKNPYQDKLVQWKFDQHATEISIIYGANILYDPRLTRVLYPKDNGVVSLVDVENEMELASAQFEDWGRLPSWSADGEYLTIVNHEGNVDEFYLVSRDGNEFQKITNFSQEVSLASVSEYSWSPYSNQIAFWLNTETNELADGAQSELAVLDIPSKQVTRLCIQGISKNAYEPWTMNHPEPIWSPDGRYIMITQWDDPAAPKKYYVLVVDTVTGSLEKISENAAPVGWMSSTP
jgi:WD40 repeat protein